MGQRELFQSQCVRFCAIGVEMTTESIGCTPNVAKKREGRALHFEVTRKIRAGQELCISYIDTDSLVDQRRGELEASWFFTCRCLRCERESSL